jgi:hypothetical protein
MVYGVSSSIIVITDVVSCIFSFLGGNTLCKFPQSLSTSPGEVLYNSTQGVTPIQCHSHNDFLHRNPVYDALAAGCTGIETDIWLFDDELFVGHNTNGLTRDRTLKSLYIDPLVALLDARNKPVDDLGLEVSSSAKQGVFDKDPSQTLVLLIDYKNNGRAIHPRVVSQLSALRDKNYLTYFSGSSQTITQGPITVVATGNAPFDLITANQTYRDIFFDAPLHKLASDSPSPHTKNTDQGQGTAGTSPSSHFNITNSYYASTNFKSSISRFFFLPGSSLSEAHIRTIREHVRVAKEKGLKARYWGTPSWPKGVRDRVWSRLVEEGVGVVSGDDLEGMRALAGLGTPQSSDHDEL